MSPATFPRAKAVRVVRRQNAVKPVAPAPAPAVKPGARLYCAFGAARQLWGCKDEEILIEGPAGTGKTRAILEKIHFCMMKYPGSRGLICRKTRESMTETVLVTFEEKVVQDGSPILSGPQRNLRQSYKYPNGSVIVVGGLDKAMKVMSSEYDIIATFESTEFTLEDFESLTTRLRNGVMPYQQIIADCNPGAPNHWLNKRADHGMTRLLSRHEDNPMLFDQKTGVETEQGAKYLRKLDRLTGARYLRLRKGKWAAAEGMVYENFDLNIHSCDPFEIPADWRRIRTIDFGFVNPFVCQWWAIDPDGTMYMYREIYRSKTLVQDHAKLINMLSAGERYEATISDHDREDRATLDNVGILTSPAFKGIEPGIEAVQSRLRIVPKKGVPRIFFFRDALVARDEEIFDAGLPTHTTQEFDGYVYPKGQDGKPLKEVPVDKDNHGMDAMRYAVAYVDNVAGMWLKVSGEELAVVKGK